MQQHFPFFMIPGTYNRDRARGRSDGLGGFSGRHDSRCADDLDKAVAADRGRVLFRRAL